MRVYAQALESAKAVVACSRALKDASHLPFRLLELVRLRIAFHNQCRVCMVQRYTDTSGAALDEHLVCSLEQPQEADDLSEAERAALAFADRVATDHLSVSDETFVALRRHFGEPELMELCFHVAWCVGFGRMNAVLQIDPLESPERFLQGQLTPWETAVPS